jgi:hypothetical protein
LRREFPAAFRRELKLDLELSQLAPTEETRATGLEQTRYSTDAWNRMR